MLCSAAFAGDNETVLCILQSGIGINAKNTRGQTALYCAANQGHAEVVLTILNQYGVDINYQPLPHKSTPLHGMSAPTQLTAPPPQRRPSVQKKAMKSITTILLQIFGSYDSDSVSLAAGFSQKGEVVALLLARGANPDIANTAGLTARQDARGQSIDVYTDFYQVRQLPSPPHTLTSWNDPSSHFLLVSLFSVLFWSHPCPFFTFINFVKFLVSKKIMS
jgi:hypothetical protein